MNFLDSVNLISRFTDTAVVSPGVTYFSDSGTSFFAKINTETPSSQDIGFYENISNFLRVVGLFNNPEITMENEMIHISENSEDHTGSAKFITSNISLIRNMQSTDFARAIEKTLEAGTTLNVHIDKSMIQRIKNSSSAIPNSKVIVCSRDGKIEFIVKDVDVLMSDSNAYRFKIPGVSTKDCAVAIDSSFFARMPGEFDLSLAFSNQASTFRAILKDDDITVVIPTAHTAV